MGFPSQEDRALKARMIEHETRKSTLETEGVNVRELMREVQTFGELTIIVHFLNFVLQICALIAVAFLVFVVTGW